MKNLSFEIDEKEKKSITVYLIAVCVVLSNLAVISVIYQVPFLSNVDFIRKSLPLISLAAVYPFDVFQNFFKGDFYIQFFWIFSVTISGFGLLFFNRLARSVFIVFSIVHFVVLGVTSVFYFGQTVFWGYFFKCYFNLVAFLFYVGYLTLPEVRAQFFDSDKQQGLVLWFLKWRRRVLLPKDAGGYFNLALAYERLGRADEALDFLNRAIVLLPDKADYHFSVGRICFQRHDYSQAVKSLLKTVELDPVHAQGRYFLGLAYQKTGCAKQALETFRRASYLEPKNGLVFRELGISCFHAGHWQEAQQALRKAQELLPADHLCPFYLGLIMSKDKPLIKNAQELFKKTIRLKPDFVDAYRELGNCCISLGDYKAAVGAFRDVLRLDESAASAHYHLGFAYVMLKDFESARREYRYLKDVDTDLAQTLNLLLSRTES